LIASGHAALVGVGSEWDVQPDVLDDNRIKLRDTLTNVVQVAEFSQTTNQGCQVM